MNLYIWSTYILKNVDTKYGARTLKGLNRYSIYIFGALIYL
jgi:hypothetical protein